MSHENVLEHRIALASIETCQLGADNLECRHLCDCLAKASESRIAGLVSGRPFQNRHIAFSSEPLSNKFTRKLTAFVIIGAYERSDPSSRVFQGPLVHTAVYHDEWDVSRVRLQNGGNDLLRSVWRDTQDVNVTLYKVLEYVDLLFDIHFSFGCLNENLYSGLRRCGLRPKLHIHKKRIVKRIDGESHNLSVRFIRFPPCARGDQDDAKRRHYEESLFHHLLLTCPPFQ